MRLAHQPGADCGRKKQAGFTLIELTISAALMAIILVAAYACLDAGVSAQRLIDPRIDAVQGARVALALLTADLRAACPLERNNEFVGASRKIRDFDADNLDFGTLNHTPAGPGEGDFCQTSYFVEQDPDPRVDTLVLWRRRNARIGLDAFVGGRRQEITRGVRRFKLEYYDGFDWFDSWGDPERRAKKENSNRTEPNLSGMPEAVRITLELVAEVARTKTDEGAVATRTETPAEATMAFQTLARLNIPASAFRASGGATSSSETPGASPANPANPVGGAPMVQPN